MKLRYIPGLRPVPMLMYYTDQKPEVFHEIADLMNVEQKTKYHQAGHHYWNMNAYVIVEEHKVISLVFSDFIYAIYLLRVINQDLEIEIPKDYVPLIEKDLKELSGELEIIE